jgi:hypothetical protein
VTAYTKSAILFAAVGLACSRSEPEAPSPPQATSGETTPAPAAPPTVAVQTGPVPAGNAAARAEGKQKTGLTSGEVQAVVKEHRAEIDTCYANSAPGAARQPGRIDVDIEIHGNGFVRNPEFSRDDFGDDALRGCVLAAMAKWRFPTWPGDGVMRVTLPFALNPQR